LLKSALFLPHRSFFFPVLNRLNPQLYISFPDSTPRTMPVRQLRGFEKPSLKAGASTTISFKLRNKDLAYYSSVHSGWTIPVGDFTVTVGSSSRKLPLSGTITI
jgi:beta-glucosidase